MVEGVVDAGSRTASRTTKAGALLAGRRKGYAMVVAAALLWAVNGTVSKVMLVGGIEATDLSEIRALGAFAVLLVLVALTRPATLRMRRTEVPWIAVYGVVGFGLVVLLYFVALRRLDVGVALLIEFTAPLFVALWARLVVHEPVRRRVWAALALSLAGLAAVAGVLSGDVSLDGLGVLAAFGAALSLAAYFLLGEHNVRVLHRDPRSLTCLAFGFAAAFWVVVNPIWTVPFSVLGEQASLLGRFADVHVPMWALAAYLIGLGTVVPFLLSIGALRYLRATQLAVVGMLEPVAAAVVAWVWLGETLTGLQVAGGIVVLVGVVLAETARRSAPGLPEAAA